METASRLGSEARLRGAPRLAGLADAVPVSATLLEARRVLVLNGKQPRRGRGDNPVPNVVDVVATLEMAIADGGKGNRKRTVACVICMAGHYTNQCSLLRGPKPSVAYFTASDNNGGFFHIQAANEHDIVSTDFSPAAALIKVESGDVSKQLLLATLARIIPIP
jgi:hypothetical protein